MERVDLINGNFKNVNKHIAIMLPFKLNKVIIDSISDTKRQINRDPYLKTSLDFYSGVLVALDSLKNLGISLKVDVYDTRNAASEISSILRTDKLNNVDAVIGPLMPDNLERVATALNRYQVPVISPLTKNVKLLDNVFQTRPSENLLNDKIVNFVKNDSTVNQIIIISDHDHTKISDNLKRTFIAAPQVFSRKDKDEKDAYFILDQDIVDKLKPGKNVVFLETDNSGLISNVTSKLNSLIADDIQIILVTTNMNKSFEDDEVSNYHLSNLQFHFPTIAKSYNEEDNNSFAKMYQSRFGITPNAIAVRGFDLTLDVVLRLANYNNLYESVNAASLTEYVENKFSYNKDFLGGYNNNAVYLVKYEDLKIVEVK
jgi:vacuolar-type H+-ATPase subunit F/Vma7